MSLFSDIASYMPHLNIAEMICLSAAAGMAVLTGRLSARSAALRYVPVRVRRR
ncbi:hypothetical protein GOB93_05990 [Acetobacter musti]|uniref:Uncharacterized protein n=1 Tax=Acetobacter musti TaxID=864732 RepID=A0ABX0JLK4_9PROT|nr:hypothetical protein [Acetobacter musti]NHN84194.1 hypothetical protein [Acetobacter musti]